MPEPRTAILVFPGSLARRGTVVAFNCTEGRHFRWQLSNQITSVADAAEERAHVSSWPIGYTEPSGSTSVNGPSRHFAAMQHFGRFRSEADMDWQAKRVGSVENDP